MAIVRPLYSYSSSGGTIPDEVDFFCGNLETTVNTIIQNLQQEQDPLTSNFILSNAEDQLINTKLILVNKAEMLTDLDTFNNDKQLITKKYCDDSIDNSINSITNIDKMEYLDVSSSINTSLNTIISSFQGQINNINTSVSNILSSDVQLNEANTWTAQNVFSNYAPKCDIDPVNLDDLVNKNYVDETIDGMNQALIGVNNSITNIEDDITNINNNITTINTSITNLENSIPDISTKQDLLTSSSEIELLSINGYGLGYLGNLQYLDITSSLTTTLNNISNDVSNKQNTLNSSSNIELNTINNNSLTNLNKLQYLDVSGSISTSLTNLTNSINAIDISGKQDLLDSTSEIELLSINGNSLTNLNKLSYLDVSGSIVNSLNTLQTNIDGKQNTIGTNLNLSTINSNDLTNLDKLQYLDVSSSIVNSLNTLQTNIDGKQPTINSSSNLSVNSITISSSTFSNNSLVSKSYVDSQNLNDAQLNANNIFTGENSFNSTVNINSNVVANSTTITPTQLSKIQYCDVSSSINTSLTNLTNSINSKQDTLTSSSNLTIGSLISKGVSENFNAITTGTNAFTLDLNLGSIFYLHTGSTLNANFSVRLNNCGVSTGVSKTATLIYNTTGKWIPNSMTCYTDTTTQITLNSSTPLYMNGTPSISTSTIMIAQFSLVRLYASNYVLATVSSYY